nr:MAG TPA: protein of unknown function (DUF4747) [Caudoviricetes sp.]
MYNYKRERIFMKEKKIDFELYRYQILPIDRQLSIFNEYARDLDELIAKKNDIFYDEILKIEEWKYKNTIIKARKEYDKNNFLLFKFAPKRNTKIEDENFKEADIDTWPSVLMAIWNDKDIQTIAVQNKKDAFAHTRTAVSVLVDNINSRLLEKNLKIHFEAIFKKDAFWSIVSKYDKKISNVRFELITPNMANISKHLSDELKDFAKNTNTARTKFEIEAEKGASLHIDSSNIQVQNMVEYASNGGGNISFRVKGLKKIINTNASISSTSIDELELSTSSPEVVVDILKKGLNEKYFS